MIKIFVIFIFGIIETWMSTGYVITANQKKPIVSSIWMLLYMLTYLLILDAAFKDTNSKLMIFVYAVSCMIGNYIRVKQEEKSKKRKKLWKRFLYWLNKPLK